MFVPHAQLASGFLVSLLMPLRLIGFSTDQYTRVHMHAYMHACIHACMHACIAVEADGTRAHTHIHTCTHALHIHSGAHGRPRKGSRCCYPFPGVPYNGAISPLSRYTWFHPFPGIFVYGCRSGLYCIGSVFWATNPIDPLAIRPYCNRHYFLILRLHHSLVFPSLTRPVLPRKNL